MEQMTDCRNDAEEREFLMERRKLSLERIRQIPDETSVPVAYREYFSDTAFSEKQKQLPA